MPFPTNEVFSDLIQRASAVTDHVGLRSALLEVVDLARTATGASYGALGVLGSYGMLSDFLYVGMDPDQAEQIGQLPIGKGVLGTLIKHPTPIVVPDIMEHHDFSGFPANHPPMHTFLGVPVRTGAEIYGNLYLTEKPGGFTPEDMATAQALGAIAGGVVSSVLLHDRLAELAVLDDRERIARDLHDSVIQDLFATGLSLQALTMGSQLEPATKDRVNDAVDRIDAAIDTLRTFIFNLRRAPVSSPAAALADSIRGLCTKGQQASISIQALETLDADHFDAISGAVREAASNSCRHSGSDTLVVRATASESEMIVEVIDHGVGFDVDHPSGGMGLANIISRMEEVGGTVAVSSEPGQGTVVTLSLPIRDS
ncbi:MAG: GAF domain-containing sensor histidine kinase [Acidimicrobiia bacterium]|nr:GAF domain-containing sensor histidine kinase [Acidimicrobiia bacterium]